MCCMRWSAVILNLSCFSKLGLIKNNEIRRTIVTNTSKNYLHDYYDKKLSGDIPSYKLLAANRNNAGVVQYKEKTSRAIAIYDSLPEAETAAIQLKRSGDNRNWKPVELTSIEVLKHYS